MTSRRTYTKASSLSTGWARRISGSDWKHRHAEGFHAWRKSLAWIVRQKNENRSALNDLRENINSGLYHHEEECNVSRRPNIWSGKRDLNPRPSPWQGDALPLSYSRSLPNRSEGCDSTEARTKLSSNQVVRRHCYIRYTGPIMLLNSNRRLLLLSHWFIAYLIHESLRAAR